MSFIPGSQGGISNGGGGGGGPIVDSANGSGIAISYVGDTPYIATSLVAGTNISLTPRGVNKNITINATGTGGIAAVTTSNGSGINAAPNGPADYNLTSALVAGPGILLTPSASTTALTITNTQNSVTTNGSGISITQVGDDEQFALNLAAGGGISIVSSGVSTQKTIANTGVLSITAGTGVSITGSASNPTINVVAGSTDGVRYSVPLTLTLTPLTNITFNPKSIFTINLPSSFTGCNVFTFYIRSFTTGIVTGSTSPITFLLYPSDTFGTNQTGVGAWDSNEGAMSVYTFTNVTNGSTQTASNVIFNWRPSNLQNNTIYINLFMTSSTQNFNTQNLQLIMDVVGQTMVLS